MIQKGDLPFALITGASAGIGFELAKLLAKDGYGLILVARNEKKLKEAAKAISKEHKTTIQTVSLDLASKDASEKLHKVVRKLKIDIEVLVNNAGLGTNGLFWENDLKKETQLVNVNILALMQLSHLFGKDMAEAKRGKILNIASTAGFQPGPLMANYYASKSYVITFGEALADELKPFGVTVSTSCPGATKTEFFAKAEMETVRLPNSPLVMDAETVALKAYQGLQSGKVINVIGFANKLLAQSIRITPRFVVRKIARVFNS